jgi:hypothetical protein
MMIVFAVLWFHAEDAGFAEDRNKHPGTMYEIFILSYTVLTRNRFHPDLDTFAQILMYGSKNIGRQFNYHDRNRTPE